MASWRRRCSSRHRAPADVTHRRTAILAAPLALLVAGCGRAGDEAPAPPPASAVPAAAPTMAAGPSASAPRPAFCVPAEEGGIRARLQGAIDADIDWSEGTTRCRGGVRPGGDGIRLIYKGTVPDAGPLLIVIGIGPLRAGESAREVPVNVTLVREGTGQFFATQGDDKCAMDELRQEPAGDPQVYRLTGRGYCVQPARAVGSDGAVLVSRFDVKAIVDFR